MKFLNVVSKLAVGLALTAPVFAKAAVNSPEVVAKESFQVTVRNAGAFSCQETQPGGFVIPTHLMLDFKSGNFDKDARINGESLWFAFDKTDLKCASLKSLFPKVGDKIVVAREVTATVSTKDYHTYIDYTTVLSWKFSDKVVLTDTKTWSDADAEPHLLDPSKSIKDLVVDPFAQESRGYTTVNIGDGIRCINTFSNGSTLIVPNGQGRANVLSFNLGGLELGDCLKMKATLIQAAKDLNNENGVSAWVVRNYANKKIQLADAQGNLRDRFVRTEESSIYLMGKKFVGKSAIILW